MYRKSATRRHKQRKKSLHLLFSKLVLRDTFFTFPTPLRPQIQQNIFRHNSVCTFLLCKFTVQSFLVARKLIKDT